MKTLHHNINVARNYHNEIEIIINCFDRDDETKNYINDNFNSDLKSGLLKLNKEPPLPFWHFCWAKNSFKKKMQGKYYASLDGDNYITREEVEKLINLCKKDDEDYLIHLFSGNWGDGTSGRVVLPRKKYLKHGYISTLFPRQFDEMALMLSVLQDDVVFVSRLGIDIFKLSGYARDFKKNSLPKAFKHLEIDFGEIIQPLMPRGEGYASKDRKLSIYQNLNAYYAMSLISKNTEEKKKYEDELKRQQEKAFIEYDISNIEKIVFLNKRGRSPELSNKRTVYSVIKNDTQFLKKWYEHYKNIGVERFIVIDDNSDRCISETLDEDDVYIFKPRVGNFKLFKTFWIKVLSCTYQEQNSWMLTVDSDEFLDINSSGYFNLSNLIVNLEKRGVSFCGGILIDMMPKNDCRIDQDNFIDTMNYHLWRPYTEKYEYKTIPSIKWAFSNYWKLSFEFDFRYRYYGTIDSLRKFPLVKFQQDINLNQGFHALGYNNEFFSAKNFFANKSIILPIKHYKFFKLISIEEKKRLKNSNIDGYFGRTQENINKIVNSN
ncbi:glycosyltransferase family 2 protein, partial [Endozoicomonas arenosclerae]|uniref:glycosyltransferase family 2 protein n=1 Tax=Endozoicomonas arenosclerae TaxID=1633495 RepID=UPI000A73F11C